MLTKVLAENEDKISINVYVQITGLEDYSTGAWRQLRTFLICLST
jgi:hypothetical protein